MLPTLGSTIFDQDLDRSNPDPSDHDERTFDFYNRCSNGVISSIRENLETWFARYPEGRTRNDLRGRLRSGDRRQWNSAFWELYVHEALRRFGYELEPHPALDGVTSRLDFLATRGDERLYVECVTLGHSAEAAARRSGVAALEAALDRSGLYDYWLELDIDEYGAPPIPHGRFVRRLRAWEAAQDIEMLARLAPYGTSALPAFRWDRDGWRVAVRAIPREPRLRGRTDLRPLGILSADEDDTPPWQAIRDLLNEKASRYGKLDAPYVIALDAPDVWPQSREALWAAFGPYAFTAAWDRDGFMLRRDGHGKPYVSGVLIGTAIQPHSISTCSPTLYENPAAEHRLPESLRWERVRPQGDEPRHVPGIEPSDLFGMPADWPGVPWPN